uniref:transporter substrate-binding domain-containing protein n=1 Tax=Ningiella ruwaisensis TaxID=2364274 RepID=UPI001F503C8A|nr:transporter substrate-binding domain-containing protein [Ningiella ruwaisensis]
MSRKQPSNCCKHKAIFLLACFITLTMISGQLSAAIWVITYPQSQVDNDLRYDYPLALLELALDKTGVRYELKPSVNTMRQAKSVKRLEENLEINVLWSMTDATREEELLPIRIPIAKGLIGWRMFIAPQNSAFMRADILTLNDMLAFEPVQGIAWPDTKILQANGFNVVTSRDYLDAKNIVSQGQADFFPRSVIEIEQELESSSVSNLALRTDIALQYPTAMYFFVNKRNVTLAKLIETGLNKAIEDGSFDALFLEHFGETIERLNLKNVRYFQLANPLLPKLTPTSKQELWYFPERSFYKNAQ